MTFTFMWHVATEKGEEGENTIAHNSDTFVSFTFTNTGVLQMLEPMECLVRQTRRSAPEPVWSEASMDFWEEDNSDTENPHFHPTQPKQARKPAKVPYNPSISPIQKRFTSTVLTEISDNPVQRASGFVRRASKRVKKTSDRIRKRGSAKISG